MGKNPPNEIEGVLDALPDVVEAAFIGVLVPTLGQAIKAYVVLTEV